MSLSSAAFRKGNSKWAAPCRFAGGASTSGAASIRGHWRKGRSRCRGVEDGCGPADGKRRGAMPAIEPQHPARGGRRG